MAAGTAAQQEHLSFLGRLGPCTTRKSPNLSSQHLHHQKPPHPHFIPVVKPSTLLPTLTSNFHPPSLRPFSLQHPPKDACQLISILTSPPVARARFAGAPSSPPDCLERAESLSHVPPSPNGIPPLARRNVAPMRPSLSSGSQSNGPPSKTAFHEPIRELLNVRIVR